MKKTIKNYCFNATQRKLDELYEIAARYTSVKNEVFQKYGSLLGLQYLSYPRQIRDEWVQTGFANKFRLQARYWKQAFDEAFSNIKSNWSNGFNRVRKSLHKNQVLTKDENHYVFYLMKAIDLLHKVLTFQSFEIPERFKDKDIRRDKIHKYIKSRIRKFTGKKPHQYRQGSFLLDENMYDVKTDNKNRLWLSIMGLKPRKRIRLLMTSKEHVSGTLRIVLRGKRIEVCQVVEIEAKEFTEGETRAIDKGFKRVITSSRGNKYGEGFNELLKVESNRLTDKNKKRNKLYAITKKYGEQGNIVKTENIRQNNLCKKKYNSQKRKERKKIEAFINYHLNRFFVAEKPSILAVEDLTYNRVWEKRLSRVVRRYFSSWLKGYMQERIDYKTLLNGVRQVVVNPAYGSQICHICGRFGIRKDDRFYCEVHGELCADYNAASNYLVRLSDHEIGVYTPPLRVKQILEARLRLSNQDSRYACGRGNPPLTPQRQSESELTKSV